MSDTNKLREFEIIAPLYFTHKSFKVHTRFSTLPMPLLEIFDPWLTYDLFINDTIQNLFFVHIGPFMNDVQLK